MYTCEFCKKQHHNTTDYAKCVATCHAKIVEENRRKEAERAAAEKAESERKKKEARDARLKQIEYHRKEWERLLAEEYAEQPSSMESGWLGSQVLDEIFAPFVKGGLFSGN